MNMQSILKNLSWELLFIVRNKTFFFATVSNSTVTIVTFVVGQ